MKRCDVMPYLVVLTVVATLVTARPPSTSENACLEITGVSSKSKEEERAYVTYTQCRIKRSHVDGGSLMGVSDAGQECREFARMYMLARHYNEKLSNKEFCSTMRSYSGTSFATDSRMMDHGSCVAGVSEILASKEVGKAAEEACQRIHPKEVEKKSACQKYVLALESAPHDGFVDSTRICDKMLTGSKNGTRNLDEEHFVYSCVQYASNVIAESPHDASSEESEKAALDVKHSCEEHLSASEKDFCGGYANLVRQRASRTELNQFCDKQYRKMHEVKAGNASASSGSTQKTSASEATEEEAGKEQKKAQPSKVEEEPAPEKEEKSQEPAVQIFKIAHARAASVPPTMVVSAPKPKPKPRLPPAPKLEVPPATPASPTTPVVAVTTAAPQAKPKFKAPDMMAMCEQTISKVSGIGLSGAVLEAATAEVCMHNLLATPTKQPKLRVQRGCRFFAKHLVDAQSQGPVDAPTFCASLSKPATATRLSSVPGAQSALAHRSVTVASPQPKEAVVADPVAPVATEAPPPTTTKAPAPVTPAVKQEVTHLKAVAPAQPVSKPKLRVKTSDKAVAAPVKQKKQVVDAVAVGEKNDEDFLNGFLDKFDANEATVKQKHVDDVQKKVGQLFGDDSVDSKAPSAAMLSVEEPKPVVVTTTTAKPAPVITTTKPAVTAEKQKSASDDFLASFLDNYDEKTASSTKATAQASSPQVTTTVAVAAVPPQVSLLDADPATPSVPPAAATTAASGDIDSLVSSFLTKSS